MCLQIRYSNPISLPFPLLGKEKIAYKLYANCKEVCVNNLFRKQKASPSAWITFAAASLVLPQAWKINKVFILLYQNTDKAPITPNSINWNQQNLKTHTHTHTTVVYLNHPNCAGTQYPQPVNGPGCFGLGYLVILIRGVKRGTQTSY